MKKTVLRIFSAIFGIVGIVASFLKFMDGHASVAGIGSFADEKFSLWGNAGEGTKQALRLVGVEYTPLFKTLAMILVIICAIFVVVTIISIILHFLGKKIAIVNKLTNLGSFVLFFLGFVIFALLILFADANSAGQTVLGKSIFYSINFHSFVPPIVLGGAFVISGIISMYARQAEKKSK